MDAAQHLDGVMHASPRISARHVCGRQERKEYSLGKFTLGRSTIRNRRPTLVQKIFGN
jgi:hypothetical protein